MTRTIAQNSALHLFFRQLAEALNDAGYDMKVTLDALGAVEIPWTETTVKERLWKKVELAMLDKESTAKLEKSEVSQVYEVLMRALGNAGIVVNVPFPSSEDLYYESMGREK